MHLKSLWLCLPPQNKMMPDVASIDIQSEVQWYMRPYLLDFLVEAHAAFALTSETFFLTLNILDRYCSKRIVYRRHYQLVGCTAMLVAAKFDELSKQVPHVKELANMCCHLYDEDMFIQMERHVLMTLDWHIGAPTTAAFLRCIFDDGELDAELEHMSMYLAEIAMYHRDFVSTRPSEVAKASLALAQIILNRRSYLGQHHWASQYNDKTLILLSQHIRKRSKVLYQKYERPHASCVAATLDSFFARHDAIARENSVGLPTPEASPQRPSVMQTPPKQRFPVNNMPPTPPITPSADSFKGYHDMGQYNAPEIPSYTPSDGPPPHQHDQFQPMAVA